MVLLLLLARLGRGHYMVAEADESDRSFLKLSPSVAVITNIDREHMDAYGSFADVQQAFIDFANKVPFYGAVVACIDDPPLHSILSGMKRRVITYGLDNDAASLTARDIELGPFGGRCVVHRQGPDRPGRLGVLESAEMPPTFSTDPMLVQAVMAGGRDEDIEGLPFVGRSGKLVNSRQIRARLEKEDGLDRIRLGIQREKTMTWLLDKAAVVQG